LTASSFGLHVQEHRAIIVVIALAIVLRIPLLLAPAHHPDADEFARWGWTGSESGVDRLYQRPDVNYPPLYLQILSMTADLARAWDVPAPPEPSQTRLAWFKTPAFMADLALGVLIYVAGRRWLSGRQAAVCAAAVLINPGLAYDTAVWGQVDSIHTAFMAAAVLGMLRRRPGWAGAGALLALLTKAQSLVVLPILALGLVRGGWRAWKLALIGGLLAAALVLMPLAGAPLFDIVRVYLGSADVRPLTTNAAYNLWYLVGAIAGAPGRDVPDLAPVLGWLTPRHLGLLLFSLWVAFVLGRLVPRRDPAATWLGCAAVSFGFFFLATQMHERYAYPAVAFAALPIWQSRFHAALFAGLSLAFLANLVLVWSGPLPGLAEASGAGARVAVAVLYLLVFGGFAWSLARIDSPRGQLVR
jgi:Gpi18-like mannosyltransferase